MIRRLICGIVLICCCRGVFAGDSLSYRQPMFVAFNLTDGLVLPNNKITFDGGYKSPHASVLSLKYGLKSRGNTWQDRMYGMPYWGIGFNMYRFSMRREMGDPFAVYLFQGARIKEFRPNVSFNYEIHLGASFHWNQYDIVYHPGFIALGSPTNVYLAGNGYFKWRLSKRFDLHAGVNFTHFSNGAIRTPNNGINTLSPYVEIAYNIHEEKGKKPTGGATYTPPPFEKQTVHDLTFLLSSRTLKLDTTEINEVYRYPMQRFVVAGLSYSYLFHTARRLKWGPSIEVVYDESVNTSFRLSTDPETDRIREHYTLGKVADRFTVGVSFKGELSMPGYSAFAQLGFDIYHKDKREERLYQIYGVKLYLTDNFFATFGVRSTNGFHSQYLYLNIGYTFSRH